MEELIISPGSVRKVDQGACRSIVFQKESICGTRPSPIGSREGLVRLSSPKSMVHRRVTSRSHVCSVANRKCRLKSFCRYRDPEHLPRSQSTVTRSKEQMQTTRGQFIHDLKRIQWIAKELHHLHGCCHFGKRLHFHPIALSLQLNVCS